MRKVCWTSAAAIAVLLFMAAPAAHAGFYVGGSMGQTSSDISNVDTSTMSVDDTDTGFKVFGGYNFMKFFSVEGGYVDVAGPSVDMQTESMTTEANGFAFEAMGVLPMGLKFQLFAEAGFFLWDAEATLSSQDFSGSASDDGANPTYGVGFAWNVVPKGQIRVEAERYEIADFMDVTDIDLDMYSAGFAYRF